MEKEIAFILQCIVLFSVISLLSGILLSVQIFFSKTIYWEATQVKYISRKLVFETLFKIKL